MIKEEIQNNITKKIKYSKKTYKNNNKTTKSNSNNTPNITSNPNTNNTLINTNNYLISPTKLTKLTQIITSQNTIQQLQNKTKLIINEAIASSSN